MIEQWQKKADTARLCRLLGVSHSGVYAACRRRRAQRACSLTTPLQAAFQASGGNYGSRRFCAALQEGRLVNYKRVKRLYREQQRQVRRRKCKKVPVVERQPLLRPAQANQVWSVVVSMTERRSRLYLLAYSPDGTAETVRNAIVQRLGGLRHTVHTLTADNGKEFADHRLIAAFLYFADPYCAWQRGSNENANGLTRQYLPRQADFSTITDAHLRWIEQRLYHRPRKVLGFKTPLEVFSEEVLNSVANQS